MLETLHVKNLAVIDEAEVEFRPGLNILTGETGAGKSVILGSVNLALGAKASKDMIRTGADYALVELVFWISNPELAARLAKHEIFLEDERIILSRRISSEGRSSAKINGETVPLSKLKEAATLLIHIHGQHENQTLLNRKNHLYLLDGYLGEEAIRLQTSYREVFQTYQNLKKELEQGDLDEEERLREISFLEFEIREIEEANLQEGEDETLEDRYRTMTHAQTVLDALSLAYDLTGAEGAQEAVGRACREVNGVLKYDTQLSELHDEITQIEDLLGGFHRELSDVIARYTFEPGEMLSVEERLNTVNHLKSKFGRTIADVLAALAEKKERYDNLQEYEVWRSGLEARVKAAKQEALEKAQVLSLARAKAAKNLAEQMKAAMLELNFAQAEFEVQMIPLAEMTSTGIDEVEFLLSTNPGEAVRPLERIASGGELSRIMLALKSVTAEKDETQTMIFDEIDAGISGRTAQKVAEKLQGLASHAQIICITHLSQIAAMADVHFAIEKSVQDARTISKIQELSAEQRVEELARMLGGVEITEGVRQNAREMSAMAQKWKETHRDLSL